jgi:hypothetical protein
MTAAVARAAIAGAGAAAHVVACDVDQLIKAVRPANAEQVSHLAQISDVRRQRAAGQPPPGGQHIAGGTGRVAGLAQ